MPKTSAQRPSTGAEIYGRYREIPGHVIFPRPMTVPELSEVRSQFTELQYVYFIGAPSVGLIKIGYSANHPDLRLDGLRGGSPVPLVPLKIVRGDRLYEKGLHRAFEPIHSHCEWFHMNPLLLEFIDRYAVPWPSPREGSVWVPQHHWYPRYSEFMDVVEAWERRCRRRVLALTREALLGAA